jgi:hypothetical protein
MTNAVDARGPEIKKKSDHVSRRRIKEDTVNDLEHSFARHVSVDILHSFKSSIIILIIKRTPLICIITTYRPDITPKSYKVIQVSKIL